MKMIKTDDGTYQIVDIDEQMAEIFIEMNSGLEEDYYWANKKLPQEPGSLIISEGRKYFRLENNTWISPWGTFFKDQDFNGDDWEEL